MWATQLNLVSPQRQPFTVHKKRGIQVRRSSAEVPPHSNGRWNEASPLMTFRDVQPPSTAEQPAASPRCSLLYIEE